MIRQSFSLAIRLLQHPANSNAIAAMLRLCRWQSHKQFGGKKLPFPFHGFMHPGYLDSHSASAAYYFNGLPDWWEMQFIMHYLRPNDSFIDVGANVGLYTLLALSVAGRGGHVHAFEPCPLTRDRLLETIAANNLEPNVTIHSAAVSNVAGTMPFGFSDDDCKGRLMSSVDLVNDEKSVETIRLDDVFSKTEFAMIKLDIEGAEPLAIDGATQMLLEGNPPVLMIEMAGYSKKFGVPTYELVKKLSRLGYRCGTYHPKDRIVHYTDCPWTYGLQNVVAIHAGKKEWVEARLAGRVL